MNGIDSTVFLYVAAAAVAVYAFMKLTGKTGGASPALVFEKIKAGARIIDVRTPGEFSQGAYPRAKNIPLDGLQARAGSLEPKDKAIVLYCASGARSAQAARILKQEGFTDVINAGSLGRMPR